MQTLTGSLGFETETRLAEAIHELEHDGKVERIFLSEKQLGRRRFRATSDAGREYGIVLDAESSDIDGLVLLLEQDRAIILRAGEPETLQLEGVTIAGALQLGWHAGHLHWRVRFTEGRLTVLLDGDEDEYLSRIQSQLDDGSIRVVGAV
jgi:urease accessory protein